MAAHFGSVLCSQLNTKNDARCWTDGVMQCYVKLPLLTAPEELRIPTKYLLSASYHFALVDFYTPVGSDACN